MKTTKKLLCNITFLLVGLGVYCACTEDDGLMSISHEQLSAGKKVNSAIDTSSGYFVADDSAAICINCIRVCNTDSNSSKERLSTGLKVNSAIDNPSSYYVSQSPKQ